MKTIYWNGEVITMEEPLYAEAVMVEDGRIKAVGTLSEVMGLRDRETRCIDLEGRTMLPAFIDSHSHMTALAISLGYADLRGAGCFDEIVERLKRFLVDRKIPDGEWIIGTSYDHNALQEKRHPDKSVLDRVSQNHPILISHQSGHMGVANSLALNHVKINSEGRNLEGGRLGQSSECLEPSGYLEESEYLQVFRLVPPQRPEAIYSQFKKAQNIYASYGITTAQEGFTTAQEWSILKALAEKDQLKLDVVSYIDFKKSKQLIENNKEYLKEYHHRLKIGGYKIFLDGSPQGRTAWLLEPYENAENGNRGYQAYEDEQVELMLRTALEENIQILSHCNGDAACQQFIDMYGAALQESGKAGMRPVMVHAQLVRHEQLEQMKPLGMMPSFFVAHVDHWGEVHLKNLGKARASHISPAAYAAKLGIPYTFHQDTPVLPPNMLHSLWCAVNRITNAGVVLGWEERVTPLEALRAVTCYGAYQYFEEAEKGSIREGKRADLVILDKNPLKVTPMEIKDIQVWRTIKDGIQIYP